MAGSGSAGPPRRLSPGLRRRWAGAVASSAIAGLTGGVLLRREPADCRATWNADVRRTAAVPGRAAQPRQPSRTRFPPSAGCTASPPGPSSHAASAHPHAASSSRFRCSCPPTTRSASGTAIWLSGMGTQQFSVSGLPRHPGRRTPGPPAPPPLHRRATGLLQGPGDPQARTTERGSAGRTALIESNPRPAAEAGPARTVPGRGLPGKPSPQSRQPTLTAKDPP